MQFDAAQYDRFLQPHRRALARLRLDLTFFLEESGPILLIDVEHRTKSFESAVEKSQRLGLPILDLDDLAGLRVVCGTQLDADSICHFFRTGLRGTSFKVLKANSIDRSAGYRAHHVVIAVDEAYTGTWQPCKVEVQVQTALQNAFNRLSRSWLYKSGRELPQSLISGFGDFAKRLDELDQVASALQTHLFTSSEGHRDNDPLTPLAYKSILYDVLQEDTDDENANWHAVYYRRCGMETCGQLRQFFNRPDIQRLYDKWRMRSTENDLFRGFAETKQQFWQTCGTRMQWATTFLESQASTRLETDNA